MLKVLHLEPKHLGIAFVSDPQACLNKGNSDGTFVTWNQGVEPFAMRLAKVLPFLLSPSGLLGAMLA